MKKIIVDFEFNCGVKNVEIIEFGAVILDENNNVISEYASFVHPVLFEVSKRATKLTGISQENVENADSLEKVLGTFLGWIGSDYEAIYSWSMSDYHQLKQECELKGINDERLERAFASWKDYQREFCDGINYSGMLSLKNAISAIDMGFKGNAHSALDDAKNTATLFEITHNPAKASKLRSIKELFAPKKSGATIGDLFPQLQMMFC